MRWRMGLGLWISMVGTLSFWFTVPSSEGGSLLGVLTVELLAGVFGVYLIFLDTYLQETGQ